MEKILKRTIMDINEELEKLKVVLDQLKELGFKNVQIGYTFDPFRLEIEIKAEKNPTY